MEFIKAWILNITVVIIFTMLLDILLPNNDMKKFAKVIMGLLIILVVMKPLLMIKDLSYQFQATMTQADVYIESGGSENNTMEVFQNNTALSIYKEKLSRRVSDIIKSRQELQESSIQVNLDIENDISKQEFGSIKSIQVLIKKDNSAIVQASTIQPVKINTETVINKKQDEYNGNNSELSQDLRAEITEELGLVNTHISVLIQE